MMLLSTMAVAAALGCRRDEAATNGPQTDQASDQASPDAAQADVIDRLRSLPYVNYSRDQYREHSWHHVPLLIASRWARPSSDEFGESACHCGDLGTLPGKDLMSLALAHATRLDKYGAHALRRGSHA